MTSTGVFDMQSFQDALDAQRHARGSTWQAVARETGVSASTLSGLRTRRVVEGDGVLQMLRWLGRTPESFVTGHPAASTAEATLPPVGPSQILRIDVRAIHAALEERRLARGMTWQQVATDIGGVGTSDLTRLAKGGRASFPGVMKLVGWLGRPLASFTRASALIATRVSPSRSR